MKNTFLFLLFMALALVSQAQANGNAIYNMYSGNAIYQSGGKQFPFQTIAPVMTGSNQNVLRIRIQGLYNERASKKIAIFNITQLGKTTAEVNALVDEKINRIRAALDSLKDETEFFVDMISFVPVYEFEREKKLFNKKTYNEIPKGFEVQKNLHIGFADENLLNRIVAICAENEVYDLVRVAYVSTHLEEARKELRASALAKYNEVLAMHRNIHNLDYESLKKVVDEGFAISYPIQAYQSYQAYNQASLDMGKNPTLNQADKKTTLHYVPAYFEQHEFVFNPEVIEPTIQLVYSLDVQILLNQPIHPAPVLPPAAGQKPEKEILFLTPQGELKKINP